MWKLRKDSKWERVIGLTMGIIGIAIYILIAGFQEANNLKFNIGLFFGMVGGAFIGWYIT